MLDLKLGGVHHGYSFRGSVRGWRQKFSLFFSGEKSLEAVELRVTYLSRKAELMGRVTTHVSFVFNYL